MEFDAEDPDLAQLARSVVTIRPNFSYTVADIKADVQRIYNTGYFKAIEPESTDTRDGVSLKFKLVANPTVRAVVLRGSSQLPVTVVQGVMKPQIGKVLNSNAVVAAAREMTQWYEAKKIGHEFVNVQITPDGTEAGNFAFDVTPARLVTKLVTERGICDASQDGLLGLYPEQRSAAE